jgi:carbamoyltransferase
VWHQLLDNPRERDGQNDAQEGSLLGPRYSEAEIRTFLDAQGAVYEHYEDETKLYERIATLLATEHVVGHCAGRMEFGPRALGARSILGDARSPKMQSVMNLKIKFRESFRPFAPIVLRERAGEYFEIDERHESPYMLMVAPVRHEKRIPVQDERARGLDKLKQLRSVVPAITHVDFSARLQTVDAKRNPRVHAILRAFEEKTGCPVLINTSFNVRGEPIVCTPQDAYRCFLGTNMDVLVLENFVLLRSAQTNAKTIDRDAYLAQFQLD